MRRGVILCGSLAYLFTPHRIFSIVMSIHTNLTNMLLTKVILTLLLGNPHKSTATELVVCTTNSCGIRERGKRNANGDQMLIFSKTPHEDDTRPSFEEIFYSFIFFIVASFLLFIVLMKSMWIAHNSRMYVVSLVTASIHDGLMCTYTNYS